MTRDTCTEKLGQLWWEESAEWWDHPDFSLATWRWHLTLLPQANPATVLLTASCLQAFISSPNIYWTTYYVIDPEIQPLNKMGMALLCIHPHASSQVLLLFYMNINTKFPVFLMSPYSAILHAWMGDRKLYMFFLQLFYYGSFSILPFSWWRVTPGQWKEFTIQKVGQNHPAHHAITQVRMC